MDDAALLALLPRVQRLALSYAPAAARRPTLALLALDARLAGIVRATHEPVLGQIRLAWWRDRLAESPDAWPEGEPLLAALRLWRADSAGLSGLVDGWEALLGDGAGRIAALSEARGRAFAGLGAGDTHAATAGFLWSLVDCRDRLRDAALQAECHALIACAQSGALSLPRTLRPLQVLYGLAQRALQTGRPMLAGPGDLLAAMRLGLLGR